MQEKYRKFRRLLSQGDDGKTLVFLNTVAPIEIMALNFLAIISPSDDIQEVKDFVIRQYGGRSKWFHELT